MQLEFKHILIMAVLLLISIAFIVLSPDSSAVSKGEGISTEMEFVTSHGAQSGSKVQLESNRLIAVGVILAKGLSAIIIGIFVLFCICSRVGKCFSKRTGVISRSAEQSIADAKV
ncbi:hypothetical protein EYS14_18685 [Alteromonadaceae bacterium M269]|nr:hypothetical protein EYS14_18685 [Alteromonadaceae bacterium M269]